MDVNRPSISARIGTLQMGEDGIARITIAEGVVVTMEVAREIIAALEKLNAGTPLLILYYFRNSTGFTSERETRQYLAEATIIKGAAMIVRSEVHKMLGNFWIRINKPRYPIRLFATDKPALEWLKSL